MGAQFVDELQSEGGVSLGGRRWGDQSSLIPSSDKPLVKADAVIPNYLMEGKKDKFTTVSTNNIPTPLRSYHLLIPWNRQSGSFRVQFYFTHIPLKLQQPHNKYPQSNKKKRKKKDCLPTLHPPS